jgi:HSP20 family protein
MNISRFEPWSLVNVLHRDLDQIATRRYEQTNAGDNGQGIVDWVPAVDIVEEKERFVLRADLPGVNPKDIDVNMENGVLSVSGQRNTETAEESDGVHRLERTSGKFYRRFTLPDTANPEEISAKIENGILEVVIPKQARLKARRIAVQTG